MGRPGDCQARQARICASACRWACALPSCCRPAARAHLWRRLTALFVRRDKPLSRAGGSTKPPAARILA
ncbi:hypothetical protein SAMN05216360_105212 [Methylobacterium phyllostachyos]|uniref:Uncharacterized protein n=1 Tax=Methylobacterium phyllostachyos TaxID=582672 RepID=A0A1G9Y8B5_9HYPH|nr:hypothetical protein SAMN05216360_105212 [Methylobacterium phyllostachyos]